MAYSSQKMATELENSTLDGYSSAKVANVAFNIYQNHCLEISKGLDHYLMMLIAMDEGPEFEMTEVEFLEILAEIRRYEE